MPDGQFELKDFRQPVVASVGVILGFLLGFLGQWVTEETFALKTAGDVITLAGSVLGALLLLSVLFRMLSPGIAPANAAAFYRRTLRVYMAAVAVPLFAMALSAFI